MEIYIKGLKILKMSENPPPQKILTILYKIETYMDEYITIVYYIQCIVNIIY